MVWKLINEPQTVNWKEIKTINLNTNEWGKKDYLNKDLIYNHIELFWSSQADFEKNGYGYAAVDANEIIGVCYSSFVTQDTHAIGIDIAPRFQNKGIGTHLANLIVNEIYHNGFTPYWDCSIDNEASKKLAERLGFILMHQYTCTGFDL